MLLCRLGFAVSWLAILVAGSRAAPAKLLYSQREAAGVSLAGVGDWNVEMKKDEEDGAEMSEPPEYIRLSERQRIEDLAYTSSPSAHIENWRGPTLLTFGDLDTLGHAESVIDLGYQLLERGVPVEFYADPAGGHNVFPQDRVFEFFERSLDGLR